MSVDQRVAALRRRSRRTDGEEAERPTRVELPSQPGVPGRRNPKWIALGVLAICLGGLLSYVVYAQVAGERTVVAMQQTVYRGQTVQADDLKTVTLNGSVGVGTVPGTDLSALVGKRAAFDLAADSIVPPQAITEVAIPANTRSLVGIRLGPGRQPGGFLQPGSTVRLVVVPPPNAQPDFTDGYQNKNYAAVVVDTRVGQDADTTLVNVDVASGQAAVVALLAATDRIAVVRDADR